MTPTHFRQVFPRDLAARLRALSRETGDPRPEALAEDYEILGGVLARGAEPAAPGATEAAGARERIEEFRDRLSTILMDVYRASGSPAAFGLLYEINYRPFLLAIGSRLKKIALPLDPQDVLQEVFFNIYRYPHKFHADRDRAFRSWASMIIRNTVFKHSREMSRDHAREMHDEEIDQRPDRNRRTPAQEAMHEESRRLCARAYVLFLKLYLAAYEGLSERERRALHMVEVEGRPYKDAAAELGIRLENLKMVVFRARKKIQRALDRAMIAAAHAPAAAHPRQRRRREAAVRYSSKEVPAG